MITKNKDAAKVLRQHLSDLGHGVVVRDAPVELMEALAEAIATLSQQREAGAVAWVDPTSLRNFQTLGHKGGEYGREWMWAKPDDGLVPVFLHPSADKVRSLVEKWRAYAWKCCQYDRKASEIYDALANELSAALSPPANGENDGR